MQNKRPMGFSSLKGVIKSLFKAYPRLLFIVIVCLVISSVTAAVPAVFQQQILSDIGRFVSSGDWKSASQVIIPKVLILVVLYVISLAAITVYTQLMAIITQGYLDKTRCAMFEKMQNMPISYFDSHKHGDIMSRYTNDIDTLRQLISQALPTFLRAGVVIISVLAIMLYYSVWMTVVVLLGVFMMMQITKIVGGGSAKYFRRQQKSTGASEAYIQEVMSGQKVVKVFNREEACAKEFKSINEELYQDSFKAHAFANVLGPVIQNVGNILYVVIAVVGGLLLVAKVPNLAISNLVTGGISVLTIDVVIPFLNMTKQFTGNVNQLSQQINSIAMAGAGAERIHEMIQTENEVDDGYVTLVNAFFDEQGNLQETKEKTGIWAWKHPHKSEGTVTYTQLKGDITMSEVDFSYVEGKQVLKNISVYARPGQQVAFVGATGAGKTTITNLFNRFYDIEDGKIRYDGININKIKKSDLRRSLGLVLQETNLFTGSVADNIRYGKLDATEDEIRAAAALAGADDFISRLPKGYDTLITNNGENLSQGQRQLIAIARAALCDPPVMILDEATSSIDTRTEQIVQRGMEKLMEGRTVFVIAHRLSTVKNSDVIMVLDHGEIIERGTHEELILAKGTYYQLYTGAFELE
ncbi:MAG: ABC transporter ATP-binding protein [Clostridia bacterium]|nr:ABC transporter ATP-binding protein [Clostridia bacterium]